MGSAPLRSIGWQGLPNTKKSGYSESHALFRQAGDTLYVRMLGRNTPCGKAPDTQTHFSNLGDDRSFWDSTTTLLQEMTWPEPDKGQKLTINAPQVPEPLTAEELKNFDQDYASTEKQTGSIGYGYGQINPTTKIPLTQTTAITFPSTVISIRKWCLKNLHPGISQGQVQKRTGQDMRNSRELKCLKMYEPTCSVRPITAPCQWMNVL